MTQPPISETDIQAYIDGRLNVERRAAVEAYLAGRPELRTQVETDAANDRALRSAFDALDLGPVPAEMTASPTRLPIRPSTWRYMAAALLLLAVGGAGGYWAGHKAVTVAMSRDAAPASWLTLATTAHKTFAVEVVHPVEVPAENAQHLAKWLGKRLDFKLAIPDLTPAGFKLMGGRLLSSETGPTGQLMYEDANGGRVTLYLRPNAGDETSFRFVEQNGVSAFYWIEEGLAMAIVGNQPRGTLQDLATLAYKAL